MNLNKNIRPLIRPKYAWNYLRSDPIALEVASDQTQVRSKRLWSDPIALEVASDQTQVRSKRLWSDPIALESAYDQTQLRSKLPLIRPKCAQNSLIRERFYLWKNLLILL